MTCGIVSETVASTNLRRDGSYSSFGVLEHNTYDPNGLFNPVVNVITQ